ncbi:MAG TPA: hypothetical protein VN736_15525 [Candidatus Limnocylindrales bacterium]|nr:hypothetical protein [Candidatus Limnocylindrales bacterium]
MKTLSVVLLAAAAITVAAQSRWENWKYDDTDKVQRSFDVGGSGAPKLLVDTLLGSVHVTAASGKQIAVSVQKHARGRSPEAIADSKRDVKLDISQQGNYVRLYVDGPFRDHDGGTNYRGDDYYGYRVEYDFDVQVPADTELDLHSLHGDINVKGTTGDLDIHGFSGKVDLEDVSGSGNIRTFNGPMKVSFARNPQRPTNFKTFNGEMEVFFKAPLNADLSTKTFNGGVYADFDVTALPLQPVNSKGGHIIYSSNVNRTSKSRVGSGGPLLSFEGFNGAIKLHAK